MQKGLRRPRPYPVARQQAQQEACQRLVAVEGAIVGADARNRLRSSPLGPGPAPGDGGGHEGNGAQSAAHHCACAVPPPRRRACAALHPQHCACAPLPPQRLLTAHAHASPDGPRPALLICACAGSARPALPFCACAASPRPDPPAHAQSAEFWTRGGGGDVGTRGGGTWEGNGDTGLRGGELRRCGVTQRYVWSRTCAYGDAKGDGERGTCGHLTARTDRRTPRAAPPRHKPGRTDTSSSFTPTRTDGHSPTAQPVLLPGHVYLHGDGAPLPPVPTAQRPSPGTVPRSGCLQGPHPPLSMQRTVTAVCPQTRCCLGSHQGTQLPLLLCISWPQIHPRAGAAAS